MNRMGAPVNALRNVTRSTLFFRRQLPPPTQWMFVAHQRIRFQVVTEDARNRVIHEKAPVNCSCFPSSIFAAWQRFDGRTENSGRKRADIRHGHPINMTAPWGHWRNGEASPNIFTIPTASMNNES